MAEQQHFEGFDAEPEEESRSSHKRQAQAIRKLVEKIANLGEQSFKLEKLRENMLNGGVEVLNGFCSLILDTDRNKLRTLIKKAKSELAADAESSKPNSRALFKYLKSEIARAGVEIPHELIK